MEKICQGLNDAAQYIHGNNKAKGFWDKERNVGEALMLVTSELGEAMDAHQNSHFADWDAFKKDMSRFLEVDDRETACFAEAFKLNIKDSFEDEVADAIIRLLDLCGGLGIDIEKHIQHKVHFNTTRPRLHGKNY